MTDSKSTICSMDGCSRPHNAKGYCGMHYRRWKDHDDPLAEVNIVGDTDARFESYIERIPPSDCEYWMGMQDKDGYGIIRINYKNIRAHRYQWERHHGPIYDGLYVLHTCHQGHHGCVAPHHLYLGTNDDNMRDKLLYGRQIRGEDQHLAKLTEDDVREIRRLRATGITLTALGKQFGITASNVSNIAKRKTWKHVE